jgi:hypothetical protein
MGVLFSLLVLVIVMGLVWWIITLLPLPEPMKQIVTVILAVICLLYLLSLLFGYATPFPVFRGRY